MTDRVQNSSFHSAFSSIFSLAVSLQPSSSDDSGQEVSCCSCCSVRLFFFGELTKGLTTAMKQIMTLKKANTRVL